MGKGGQDLIVHSCHQVPLPPAPFLAASCSYLPLTYPPLTNPLQRVIFKLLEQEGIAVVYVSLLGTKGHISCCPVTPQLLLACSLHKNCISILYNGLQPIDALFLLKINGYFFFWVDQICAMLWIISMPQHILYECGALVHVGNHNLLSVELRASLFLSVPIYQKYTRCTSHLAQNIEWYDSTVHCKSLFFFCSSSYH